MKYILILVRFQYLFDDCHWNLYNACHLIANNFSFVLAAQTSVLLNCLNLVIVFKGVGLYCYPNISLFSRYFNELAFLRADVRLMPLGNSGKEPSRVFSSWSRILSIKESLPSKVVFHQRSSSIKGKVVFHQRSSSM